MKTFITSFILLIGFFASAQFSRSFLHATSTNSINFCDYHFVDYQKNNHLVSLLVATPSELKLVHQTIDSIGNVQAFDNLNYSISFPNSFNYYTLLGVVDVLNSRFMLIGLGNASSMKLVWLKTDLNTGALLATSISTEDYKTAYFEPELIGNEWVTYMVNNSGLVRLSMNTVSFVSPTQELVSTSINSVPTFGNK